MLVILRALQKPWPTPWPSFSLPFSPSSPKTKCFKSFSISKVVYNYFPVMYVHSTRCRMSSGLLMVIRRNSFRNDRYHMLSSNMQMKPRNGYCWSFKSSLVRDDKYISYTTSASSLICFVFIGVIYSHKNTCNGRESEKLLQSYHFKKKIGTTLVFKHFEKED